MAKQTTGIKKFQAETLNKVQAHLKALQDTGDLHLPSNYSPGNALRFAWLKLQTMQMSKDDKRLVLEACTQASICNALLEMVVKGMSLAKKHGALIPRGNLLTWQDQYAGKLMQAKRDAGVVDTNAQVIYEGDKYVTRINNRGIKELVEHSSPIQNINFEKIKGAYCIVEYKGGALKLEEMTMWQIRNAWEQGQMKGKSKAHTKFTDEMCKKTVISRACKVALDSSDDSSLVAGIAPSKAPDDEARDRAIEESASETILDAEDHEFEEVEEVPEKKPEKKAEPKPKKEPEEKPQAPEGEVNTEKPPF